MKKATQIATAAVFALLLVGGMTLHLLLPDQAVSRAERRKLAQRPALTASSLLDGSYAGNLEDYLLDQFPLRDGFRTVKSLWNYYLLGQKDNNGVFLEHGTVSKLDSQLDQKQVELFVSRMNSLRSKLFPDSQVTVAIVPDKNYYLTNGENYPRLDYEALYETVQTGLPWADHLDLRADLDWDLYYSTDSHWRQEKLQQVVEHLALQMDLELPALDTYEQTALPGFYGVYYGQAALPLPAETLYYLENDVTRSAVVTGPELKGEQPVYAPEKFQGMDGYDVFLHGAQAVLTVENPLAETDRELVIFRDSFGSSLAPLLLPAYKTITLVDIRYVASEYVGQFVDFHGQDVLILYSTTLINGAGVLR